jgi:hypothetical protein
MPPDHSVNPDNVCISSSQCHTPYFHTIMQLMESIFFLLDHMFKMQVSRISSRQ